jgi:hypothetical protein
VEAPPLREALQPPQLVRGDTLALLLRRVAKAEALVLNGEPHRQESDAHFEHYQIARSVGPISDTDRADFVALISDSRSDGGSIKLGAMSPTFGLRFIAAPETLTALLTFGQENHWAFRHGTHRYIGHFDSVGTEMRALVARVAPDADVH